MIITKSQFHNDDTVGIPALGGLQASIISGEGNAAGSPIALIEVVHGLGNVLVMTHAQARALAEAILAQLAAEGK